jgi:hypothetical protein
MKNNNQNSIENSTNHLQSSVSEFCELEQKRQLRRQQVRIITSYLITKLKIAPCDTNLVLALCNRLRNNNFEALVLWVDNRFDLIGPGHPQEWELTLEMYLNDIYQ